MKTERNILIAFLLNLAFSLLECVGGWLTGSVAILSDALHDLGDAAGIGISYLLERKSKTPPDDTHTYGYARYSVIGGGITAGLLVVGAVVMIVTAVHRVFNPVAIRHDGMIGLAIVGVCVNAAAAFTTHKGESLNQKAVNLHMLEDVLGWVVVLAGAVVMKWVSLPVLDPLMTVGVSLFILIKSVGTLNKTVAVFLEKVPQGITLAETKARVGAVKGVRDVHHLHLWSLDGVHHCATLHIVTDGDPRTVKEAVRDQLHACGIGHVTIETETEPCGEAACHIEHEHGHGHCH